MAEITHEMTWGLLFFNPVYMTEVYTELESRKITVSVIIDIIYAIIFLQQCHLKNEQRQKKKKKV